MRETDIRPSDLFAEYIRLSAHDAQTLFDPAGWTDVDCPACGSGDKHPAFAKFGFSFVTCGACDSLFVSPRPSSGELDALYGDSPSARYWAEVFLPAVIDARRKMIFAPRVERVAARCRDHGTAVTSVVDVGAGHGIFLEEWQARHPGAALAAVEPGAALVSVLRGKGFEVLPTTAERATAWRDKGDLVTCFEVVEHVREPLEFARALYDLTAPSGVTLITGLGGDGFDIRVLGELSRSVSPPHHMNFLSASGFEALFRRAGFTRVEVETPGRLDVDIVRGALEDPATADAVAGRLGGFERAVLEGTEEQRAAFQDFLAANRLSSHVWVWAFK